MNQTLEIPADDLPYWMRQAQRGWDWGLILVAVFSLLAAWPFIVNSGLPRTNAAENYVFLTADYSDALHEGRLYPRWSPNTFSGYGAPIPNYFPPGAPYVAALIKLLFTDDSVLAVRIVFILAHLIAGTALYAFVRRRTSANTGLLAAIIFLYSPYFGNVAPFIRGDLAEFAGIALTPLLLLAVDRLKNNNQPADLLAAALVAAALLLTHPWIALVAMTMALLHVMPGRWLPTIFSLILGAGLAAFYWLPALIERDLVTWIERPAIMKLALNTLFTPLQTVDLSQLLPNPQLTLGLATLPLLLLALGIMAINRTSPRFYLQFLLIGTLLTAIGLRSLTNEVWLLGPISLCFAISSSAVLKARAKLPQNWQRLYPAALLTMILATALPILLVPRWPLTFGDALPGDQIDYEQQGAGIAVLPPHWPIPSGPSNQLPPNHYLLSGYQIGSINKIAPIQTASRSRISLLRHATHQERFQVSSNVRLDLNLLTAWFPGWQATAADQPVSLSRDEQTGLIAIQVPPINGELVIALGPTPVRQAAWMITSITLVALVIVTRRRFRHIVEPPQETDLLPLPEARFTGLILAAFALIATLLANPAAPLTLHARPGHAIDNAISLRHRTAVGLEALAYSLESFVYQPGDDLTFTLYLQAIRTLPANYQARAYLIENASGTRWQRTPLHRPGNYPTSRWRTYQYLGDHYIIPLSETIIPGEYRIAIEIFNCETACNDSHRLNFFNADGQPVGQTLILPTSIRIVI